MFLLAPSPGRLTSRQDEAALSYAPANQQSRKGLLFGRKRLPFLVDASLDKADYRHTTQARNRIATTFRPGIGLPPTQGKEATQ
jgi:hypothetical protein